MSALYPRQCALCRLLSEDGPVCPACREGFIPAVRELSARSDEQELDFRARLFRYENRAAQAVRRLKYGRATSLAGAMANEMREGFERLRLDPDYVVPVPIHWSRRCARGFNQAELLGEALPNVVRLLHRVRRTRPQVGLTRDERARNLAGAFRAESAVANHKILLIDDVLTSGQTARECAKALRAAGATEVGILAFCGEA